MSDAQNQVALDGYFESLGNQDPQERALRRILEPYGRLVHCDAPSTPLKKLSVFVKHLHGNASMVELIRRHPSFFDTYIAHQDCAYQTLREIANSSGQSKIGFVLEGIGQPIAQWDANMRGFMESIRQAHTAHMKGSVQIKENALQRMMELSNKEALLVLQHFHAGCRFAAKCMESGKEEWIIPGKPASSEDTDQYMVRIQLLVEQSRHQALSRADVAHLVQGHNEMILRNHAQRHAFMRKQADGLDRVVILCGGVHTMYGNDIGDPDTTPDPIERYFSDFRFAVVEPHHYDDGQKLPPDIIELPTSHWEVDHVLHALRMRLHGEMHPMKI